MRRFIVFTFILCLAFSSCMQTDTGGKDKNSNVRIVREYFSNGYLKAEISVVDNKRHGITKNFSSKGKLLSKVNYVNGRKDGKTTNYYTDGSVHSTIMYKNGIREGNAIWYYKNGKPYSINPYVNNELNGVQKKYYESGKIQAEVPYKDGQPGTGLKEYTPEGKLLTNYPGIIIQEINQIATSDRFILKIYLSRGSGKVQFYLDDLDAGKYLKKHMYEIPTENGVAKKVYEVPSGYVKFQKINIIASVKTVLGNTYITQRSYNLAIQH
ncbi:MAG: toxin-antitoxin system YwqK family antitoxin [Bacteroidales bacterium]|nr:MAG: toxin-antitoxin system YwqK family antitoxin [Bacteroidales bacterium]